MTYDVFISHSKVDEKYAIAAHDTLESSGLKCWIAPKDIDPGEEWGDEIIKAIKSSRVMLVVLSSSANKSKHIRREVTQAEGEGLPVIVFRIEDVMPEGSLAYYFNTIHWLDAFPEPKEKHPQLIAAVRRSLIGDPASIPTPPPPPPFPRWLIVAAAALLAAAAVGALLFLRPNPSPNAANAVNTPPANTAGLPPSPTGKKTPSTTPATPNANATAGPAVTPTAPPPPSDTDAKVTQLIGELNAADSTEGVRSDVISRLGELAAQDLNSHKRVVSQLTEFIRRRAAKGAQCSMRKRPFLPADIQAALDVLAARRWYYANGETERLELSETDLDGANFSQKGVHFEGVRLRNACLNNAILVGATFRCAYLSGASVKDIDVNDTDFYGADLSGLKGLRDENDFRALFGVALHLGMPSCAQ
ncbi:MAG: TIR domain-containing protein [Acidobacteria bacterium]|nr:TIR domain-containing protein [Acidobacteriota bacterium]